MIRMTAQIAGYTVELTGTADEVVAELEQLQKELTEPAKAKKTGPGTHDDQPDLPLKEEAQSDSEPEPTDTKAQEPSTVSDSTYTIEDVRAALKDADEDARAAAKAFITEKAGKPYLPDLPKAHYAELMAVVNGGSNDA